MCSKIMTAKPEVVILMPTQDKYSVMITIICYVPGCYLSHYLPGLYSQDYLGLASSSTGFT